MKIKNILLFSALALVVSACSTLLQMAALSKCEFKIDSVKNTRLAGLSIQGLRGFNEVKLTDATKVVAAFASGKLPLEFTLNVAVRNPNKMDAAMTKLDWEALLDQPTILTGTVNQHLRVPANGGTAILPLNVSVNLKQLFSTLKKEQLLDLGFGLADASDKPTRVALKLKPTVDVAGRPVTYPGWFTVKRDFTAGS